MKANKFSSLYQRNPIDQQQELKETSEMKWIYYELY